MNLLAFINQAKEITIWEGKNPEVENEVRITGLNGSWEVSATQWNKDGLLGQRVEFVYNPSGLVDWSDYSPEDFKFFTIHSEYLEAMENAGNPFDLKLITMYLAGHLDVFITYRDRSGKEIGYFFP